MRFKTSLKSFSASGKFGRTPGSVLLASVEEEYSLAAHYIADRQYCELDSNDRVRRWRDRVNGIDFHTEDTMWAGAVKPQIVDSVLRGFPVIRFTAANSEYMRTVTHNIGTGLNQYIYVIGRFRSLAAGNKWMMSYNNGSQREGGILATNAAWRTYIGTTLLTSTQPSNTNWHCFLQEMIASSGSTFRIDGVATSMTGTCATVARSFYQLGASDTETEFGDVDIREILVFDRTEAFGGVSPTLAVKLAIDRALRSQYSIGDCVDPFWRSEESGTSVLVAGTVTVSVDDIRPNPMILLAPVNAGTGTRGHLSYTVDFTNNQFTINSSEATDDRIINWLLVRR